MHLDHGPCEVAGPTDPVILDNEFIRSKVDVPRKCSQCVYLSYFVILGFYCMRDADKWGDFHRSLDWGDWKPPFIYVSLRKIKTTPALSRLAHENSLIAFVKEYRLVNPDVSMNEAKADFDRMRTIIAKYSQ
jgi:hypothetical protein